MKHFDEQDLIAYHLHEISPQRKIALEQALEADPFLAAESEAYAATLRVFKPGSSLPVDEQMLARNWRALRPSLTPYRVRRSASRWWGLAALTSAGLALAATSFFVAKHFSNKARLPRMASTLPFFTTPLSDNAPSVPPSEAPSNPNPPVNTAVNAPVAGERAFVPKQAHTANPFSQPSIDATMGSSPRRIASLPFTAERPPILRLIPLAPGSSPALPALLPLSITVEPVAKQAVVPKSSPKLKRVHASVHHEYPSDLTLAMGGTLIGTRTALSTSTGTISQGATHAISALAAFHQQLRPAVGYRIAFSYTRPDFLYDYHTLGATEFGINIDGRAYEVAGTYVVQGPHTGRLSTAVEAGAGVIGFEPSPKTADTGPNVRAAAVAGVSAEIALTKNLAIHTAFRAQVFKGPDFQYSGNAIPLSTATLFSAEPMMGITYRFSPK